jgi:hypothetical protein
MLTRTLLIALLCVTLVSGCSLPGMQPTPTISTNEPAPKPAATMALPPAYTPTPSPTWLPTLMPTPSMASDDQSVALRPDFAEDAGLFPGATRYWIEINIDFDVQESIAHIDGLARINFTNPLEGALRDMVLMLWPNDMQYQASMTAGPILVEGQLIDPDVELDGVALRFRLPQALPAKETIDVSLPFSIKAGTIHSLTPKRFGLANGVLIAPTFYPLIPRLVDGEWQMEAAPPGGDTTNSDIAFYSVQITSPADYILVAAGTEVERTEMADETQRVVYISGPMRDFAFALGNFVTASRKVSDVTVNAWVLPEHVDDIGKLMRAAVEQIELLSELVGPYPYTELDLVDAPGAFAGIEYPGLVYIGTLGTLNVIEPTVHEVAHQWFYGLIGDDQLHEPWLDEAAATYAEALYYERVSGVGAATGFLSNLRALLRNEPNASMPIGLGVGEYPSEEDYWVLVYFKGALFIDALRRELGDRVFFEFLSDYYQQYRYGFASSQGFQASAEAACDCDLQALFDLWVYQGGEFLFP